MLQHETLEFSEECIIFQALSPPCLLQLQLLDHLYDGHPTLMCFHSAGTSAFFGSFLLKFPSSSPTRS